MNTKTTPRFENAVSKLYNAFHKGELNPMDSCACAVGNLCGNVEDWNKRLSSLVQDENIPRKYQEITGYSAWDLRNVESLFMAGTKGSAPFFDQETVLKNFRSFANDKESQFIGLCLVVEYLAELDNIPNPMDYKSLFETENDKPKRQLIEVFQCN